MRSRPARAATTIAAVAAALFLAAAPTLASQPKAVSLHVFLGSIKSGSIYHVPLPGDGKGRAISTKWRFMAGLKAYGNHVYVLSGPPKARAVYRFSAPHGNGRGLKVTAEIPGVRAMDVDAKKVFLLAKGRTGGDDILWAPITGKAVSPKRLVTLPGLSDFAVTGEMIYALPKAKPKTLLNVYFRAPGSVSTNTLAYAMTRLDGVTRSWETTLMGADESGKQVWLVKTTKKGTDLDRVGVAAPFSQAEVFSNKHIIYYTPGPGSGKVRFLYRTRGAWYGPVVSAGWKDIDFVTGVRGTGRLNPTGSHSETWNPK